MHEHPVWVNPDMNAWIITGYHDLRQAGLDSARLSSAEGIFLPAMTAKSMITSDRPDHTRLRGVTTKIFTRDEVGRIRPDIEAVADEGITKLLDGDVVDVVDAICIPVPMSAIAVLLGIPPERWRDFRRWSGPLSKVFSPGSIPGVVRLAAKVMPYGVLFRQLIESELAARADHRKDDVLGALHNAMQRGEVDDTEAFFYAVIVLLAGHETTTNLLGAAFLALSQRPALFARLREDRDLIPAATEEFLRWCSPVQWVARWTTEPYDVGGSTIPESARVMLPWMFGNRDPRRFENPNDLDVDRDAKGHLGFGQGIHFCLGAHLARLETSIVLNRLFDRVEQLELAGPVRYSTTVSLHGPAVVPLRGW
jgi:cytochrome P450